MNKGVAVLGGVGLGAALMYFFDPQRGTKRRTLVRDKATSSAHKVSELMSKTNRDLRNRAYGIFAEAKGLLKHEDVSDEVLVDRVRSKLGRVCSTIHSLKVNAHDGVVRLEGRVPPDELEQILRSARFVRGVKEVENRVVT